MISTDLLAELRELDPDSWDKMDDAIFSIRCELRKYEHHSEEARFIMEAVIQAALQEAIRARGWFFQLDSHGNEYIADITIFEPKCDIIDGPWANSPAEALLQAYLRAVKT